MKIPMAMWVEPHEMVNIYVIECAGFIKVGIATSIEHRLQQLQAMNPLECVLRHSIQVSKHYARKVEWRIHDALAKKGHAHRYEWFKCSAEDAIEQTNTLKAWHDDLYAGHLKVVQSDKPPADLNQYVQQRTTLRDFRIQRALGQMPGSAA